MTLKKLIQELVKMDIEDVFLMPLFMLMVRKISL